MDALVADLRLPVVSFTGSEPVGWHMRDSVPRRHVTLELGANAANVVCADRNSDADLERGATWIADLGMGPVSRASRSSASSPHHALPAPATS